MLKPYNRAELQFDIIREIGGDGQNSRTYVIYDHQLGAEIVAKQIRKADLAAPDVFFAEAKALYASAHPNVVQIYYACSDNDHIYLAMPHYQRGSVKSVLQQRHLTVREIVTLGCQTLAGIHNIHSKRLIHFDIKPDNILLSPRGEALLSDFGLAKQINARGIAEQDRFYVKTLPPEAIDGAFEHDVRFDIYQFGLTLYRMCNGDAVFQDQFAAFIDANGAFDRNGFRFAVRNGRFPDRAVMAAHIPRKLRTVIKACLERDPAQRPQSAIEVSNMMATIDTQLDWHLTVANGTRVWRKNESGTEYEFTASANGETTLYKASNGAQRRRVAAGCRPQMTEQEIVRALGTY